MERELPIGVPADFRDGPVRLAGRGWAVPSIAPPDDGDPAMAPGENKAVVRRELEALVGGDDDAVDAVMAPGYVGHRPTLERSRVQPIEALKRYFAGARAAFPDLSVSVEAVIGEGDMVAARYRYRGTHHGEYHGFPATGKPAAWAGMIMARISDGKIVESWVSEDDLALRQQLGMP